MAKLTKKQQAIAAKIDSTRSYAIADAVALLNEFASPKFKESIDVSINLGVDPRKSDQVVRGSTLLPNGTGKDVRVAVFAQGDNATKAKEAGADIVGFDDLAESIQAGNMDFDVVIATLRLPLKTPRLVRFVTELTRKVLFTELSARSVLPPMPSKATWKP
mgnify:CR=1 FL=1